MAEAGHFALLLSHSKCLIVVGSMTTSDLGEPDRSHSRSSVYTKVDSWEACGFHREQENLPVESSFAKIRT